MDTETADLVAVLRTRDELRDALQANDRTLARVLASWATSRPGHKRGKTTEAGARFVLGKAGLL